MKKYLVILGLILTSAVAHAQSDIEERIRSAIPDSTEQKVLIESFQHFQDSLTYGKYEAAYKEWKLIAEKIPTVSLKIYTGGRNMFRGLIEQYSDDPVNKQFYFEKLMKMYDMRLQNLSALKRNATNSDEQGNDTQGNILTRKAADFFDYYYSDKMRKKKYFKERMQEAYGMFKEGINDVGHENAMGGVLSRYINCSLARLSAFYADTAYRENYREDFYNDYIQTIGVVDSLLNAAKEFAITDSLATHEDSVKADAAARKAEKIVNEYTPVRDALERCYTSAGGCPGVVMTYYYRFDKYKDNKPFLLQILDVLDSDDHLCAETDSLNYTFIYKKLLEVLDPTAYEAMIAQEQAAAEAARKKGAATATGNLSGEASLAMYQEQYSTATGSTKAKIAYNIARLYYKQGRLGDCERWCRNAIAADSRYGRPYLTIASCIVRSAPPANQNVKNMLNRSYYYCLAIDKCNRAKAVDPTCANEAAASIRSYELGLFPKAEAFMAGVKAGTVVTVRGETTTIKLH